MAQDVTPPKGLTAAEVAGTQRCRHLAGGHPAAQPGQATDHPRDRLGTAFVAFTLFALLGDLFALQPLTAAACSLVVGAFALWFVVMRYVWHWRLMEKFVGA